MQTRPPARLAELKPLTHHLTGAECRLAGERWMETPTWLHLPVAFGPGLQVPVPPLAFGLSWQALSSAASVGW